MVLKCTVWPHSFSQHSFFVSSLLFTDEIACQCNQERCFVSCGLAATTVNERIILIVLVARIFVKQRCTFLYSLALQTGGQCKECFALTPALIDCTFRQVAKLLPLLHFELATTAAWQPFSGCNLLTHTVSHLYLPPFWQLRCCSF